MSDSEYSIHFQHSPAIASYLKTATPSSLPPWHLRRPSRPSPGWEGDGGGDGREVMRPDVRCLFLFASLIIIEFFVQLDLDRISSASVLLTYCGVSMRERMSDEGLGHGEEWSVKVELEEETDKVIQLTEQLKITNHGGQKEIVVHE
ncbi:hypothetical protein C8J56DRAFT_891524 [Mycena floridula]|nr:hypothetical protein C8J56DRAFT_891524 [Mycena floridula]